MKLKYFHTFFFSIIFLANPAYAIISPDMQTAVTGMADEISQFATENTALAVSELVVPAPDENHERVAYAISEYITETLVQKKKFRVIEKKQIGRIIKALELNQTGLTDASSAEIIGKLVGAKFMLLGSVTFTGESYQVSVRLVEIQTGQIKLSKSFILSADSAEVAASLYRPPSFRFHVSMALNYYGLSQQGTAMHNLGMGFGYKYNTSGRHWAGFQLNPWFYHFYSQKNIRNDGSGNNVNFYMSSRNAVEFLPGYVYRLPMSRFLSFNFGLYGGAIVYTLYESHEKIGIGSDERISRNIINWAPIIFPQFEIAIMDTQAFSFFIRLGYFALLTKTRAEFGGIIYDQYPMGGRLEGGVAFFY